MKIPLHVLKDARTYGLNFSKAGKSVKNFGSESINRTKSRQRKDATRGRIGELMFAEMVATQGYTIFLMKR